MRKSEPKPELEVNFTFIKVVGKSASYSSKHIYKMCINVTANLLINCSQVNAIMLI